MFSQFTWSEFLLAIGGISAVYYLAVVLLYYRNELRNGFKTQSAAVRGTNSSQQSPSMMGPSKPYATEAFTDPGVRTVSSEDVVVEEAPEVAEPAEGSLETSMQSLSQFLKEAKVLAVAARQEAMSPEESNMLFKALIEKYTHLKQAGYSDYVSILLHRLISENLPHHIQLVEVERWWTS